MMSYKDWEYGQPVRNEGRTRTSMPADSRASATGLKSFSGLYEKSVLQSDFQSGIITMHMNPP